MSSVKFVKQGLEVHRYMNSVKLLNRGIRRYMNSVRLVKQGL